LTRLFVFFEFLFDWNFRQLPLFGHGHDVVCENADKHPRLEHCTLAANVKTAISSAGDFSFKCGDGH
jgi:hypothetical protein